MKKEIKDDMFKIVQRVKSIDKDYFVMYDTNKKVYELHHKKEKPTFLITLFDRLDKRSIEKVYKSLSKNSFDIFRAIDKTNDNLDKYAHKLVLDKAKNNLDNVLPRFQYF